MIDPVHVLEPLYVPVMEVPETLPLPDTVELHDANEPLKPPTGTVSEKLTVDPESVPETEPLPVVPLPLSVIVSVPENELPFCVTCQAIVPGPEESDAFPFQLPAMLAGDGSEGDPESPPLLQAVSVKAAIATAQIVEADRYLRVPRFSFIGGLTSLSRPRWERRENLRHQLDRRPCQG